MLLKVTQHWVASPCHSPSQFQALLFGSRSFPKHPLSSPSYPRPSEGCGKANPVVPPIKFGVVLPNEAGSQDPEGAGGGRDVQTYESHTADVFSILGLLQKRGSGGDVGNQQESLLLWVVMRDPAKLSHTSASPRCYSPPQPLLLDI